MAAGSPDRASCDLGHGVVVSPAGAGEWTVTSRSLYLHWHPRCASFPGTAVSWQDEIFEVADRETLAEGWRWRLVLWVEGEVARTVAYLGAERVQEIAAVHGDDVRRRRIRTILVALLPLSGALPQPIQKRLEREVNFPAGRATAVSAVSELAVGTLAVLQLLVAMLGGGWVLPPVIRWVVLLGPLLFVEGWVRHRLESSHDEPFGSLLLAPVRLLDRPVSAVPRAEDLRPTAVGWQPGADELELTTAALRSDWVVDGVLHYRGRPYRLVSRAGRFDHVVYRFEAAPEGTPATLQLRPPAETAVSRAGAGVLETLWRTALMSFAPAGFQEGWFRPQGTSPVVASLASAAIEVIGPGVNLLSDPARGPWVLADLVVLLDGLARLVMMAVQRGPVGSLFGLPLVPVYRRWLQGLASPGRSAERPE